MLTQKKPETVNNPVDKLETVLFSPMGENRKGEGGLRTKGYFKKSYEERPLISIITVVHNGEKYLEDTIQSVINQTYSNIEYILIDGGSTDGILNIMRKYEDKIFKKCLDKLWQYIMVDLMGLPNGRYREFYEIGK